MTEIKSRVKGYTRDKNITGYARHLLGDEGLDGVVSG